MPKTDHDHGPCWSPWECGFFRPADFTAQSGGGNLPTAVKNSSPQGFRRRRPGPGHRQPAPPTSARRRKNLGPDFRTIPSTARDAPATSTARSKSICRGPLSSARIPQMPRPSDSIPGVGYPVFFFATNKFAPIFDVRPFAGGGAPFSDHHGSEPPTTRLMPTRKSPIAPNCPPNRKRPVD